MSLVAQVRVHLLMVLAHRKSERDFGATEAAVPPGKLCCSPHCEIAYLMACPKCILALVWHISGMRMAHCSGKEQSMHGLQDLDQDLASCGDRGRPSEKMRWGCTV